MSELFLSVLEISLSTSLIVLALLVSSQLINKRYLSKWKYFIWIALALRLAVPVKLELPQKEIVFEMPAGMAAPIVTAVSPGAALTTQVQSTISPLDVMAWIWLAGCVVFLLLHFLSYLVYRRRVVVGGRRVRDPGMLRIVRGLSRELGISGRIPVITYAGASSPMVLGFFRPILVLPELSYREEELGFILRHELIHLKRHDIFFKLLFVIANAVHWFNPVIYWMQKEAVVDMELSCDETVVQGGGYDTRKAYTETLLSTLCRQYNRSTNLSTQFYGGKKVMKMRFVNILSRAKKKNGMLFLVIILCAMVAVGAVIGISAGQEQPAVFGEGEGEAAAQVALELAMARFHNDLDAMQPYLADGWEGMIWHVYFDQFPEASQLRVREAKGPNDVSLSDEKIPLGSTATMVIEVNDVHESDNFIVCLIRQENGWRAYDFGFEKMDGFGAVETAGGDDSLPMDTAATEVAASDKELQMMVDTADRFTRAYLGGDLEDMQSMLAYSYQESEPYQGPPMEPEDLSINFAPTPYDLSVDPAHELSVYSETIPQGSRITMAVDLPGASAGLERLVIALARMEEGWKVADYGFARRGITATEEDSRQIEKITEAFTAAYFDGDDAALDDYVLQPRDRFSSGAYDGKLLKINGYRGLPRPGDSLAENGQVPVSVEFLEEGSPDSYTYLSLEFVKQGNEWKINSYGLEK